MLRGLTQFQGKNRLRKECLKILTMMINPREFLSLREVFNRIDTNGSGTIEIEELKEAVRLNHVEMTEKVNENEIKELSI